MLKRWLDRFPGEGEFMGILTFFTLWVVFLLVLFVTISALTGETREQTRQSNAEFEFEQRNRVIQICIESELYTKDECVLIGSARER